MGHVEEDREPVSLPPEVDEPEEADTRSRRERWRADREHVKTEANVVLRGLERIRAQSRTVSAGFLIFEQDREFPTSLLVGALAARLVIFTIPFMILVIFAIGLATEFAQTDARAAAENAGIPELFVEAASDSTAASGGLRGFAVLVTAFATVWAANGIGKTLQLSFAVIWRTHRRRVHRSWLVPVVVISFVLFSMTINGLVSRVDRPSLAQHLVLFGIELVAISSMWLVASRLLPHDPDAGRWRDFLPGALMVAAGVVAMRAAMVFYLVPKWDSLGDRYGDIGIVLVMLSWAYIVGASAVFSAYVNSALFKTRPEPSPETAGDRSWPLADFARDQWKRLRGEPEQRS